MSYPLSLIGEVNDQMARLVLGAGYTEKDKIDCVLYSEGGDVGAALAIYDKIQGIHSTACVATGLCGSSAAMIILQGFHYRLATKSTQFVIHEATFDDEEFQDMYAGHMNKEIRAIMRKRIPEKNLTKCFKLGIFNAATALELNLIDGIK